uniref:Uncharacterized protein n=1 Tax=Arundo donax TaxID=35708 RepID=A0A0A9C5D6_ARUDO
MADAMKSGSSVVPSFVNPFLPISDKEMSNEVIDALKGISDCDEEVDLLDEEEDETSQAGEANKHRVGNFQVGLIRCQYSNPTVDKDNDHVKAHMKSAGKSSEKAPKSIIAGIPEGDSHFSELFHLGGGTPLSLDEADVNDSEDMEGDEEGETGNLNEDYSQEKGEDKEQEKLIVMPSHYSERLVSKMNNIVAEKASPRSKKRNFEGLLKGVSKEDLLKDAEGLIQAVAQAVAARATRTRMNPPVARLTYVDTEDDQAGGDRAQED